VDYARAAEYAMVAIRQCLDAGLSTGQVASINLPALEPTQTPAGVKIVRQCTRPWLDRYERRKDPRGRDYFWNSSVFTLGDSDEDTDVSALRKGYITITPLQFDLTAHELLGRWSRRKWTSEWPVTSEKPTR